MTADAFDRHTGRRWAVLTSVAGTVFIAAGAFWLSFTALADLAARSGVGASQAWAWPLIVDGIIVVATVSAVALAGQRSAWYPWALLIGGAAVSVTANAIHAVVAADADVPGVLAAAVAAVPPVVLLAITHLTVILTRPVADEAAPRDHAPDEQAPAPLAAVVEEPSRVESTRPGPADGNAPRPASSSGSSRRPHQVTVEPGRRKRAEELRQRGWSNKRIARELGVHASTVGRWFASAHLPDNTERIDAEEAKDS